MVNLIGNRYRNRRYKKRLEIRANKKPKKKSVTKSLRIGSYNIDGLSKDRLDCVTKVLHDEGLDILAVQETKLRKESTTNIEIAGYSCIRAERGGIEKGGGGLCTYVKTGLKCHSWEPPAQEKYEKFINERQWSLIKGKYSKLAVLNVYMAAESKDTNDHIQWNEDMVYRRYPVIF